MRSEARRRGLVVAIAAPLFAAVAGCPALLSNDFHVVDDDGGGVDATTGPDAPIAPAVDGSQPPSSEAAIADAGIEADTDLDAPATCCPSMSDPLGAATFMEWTPIGTARAFSSYTELCSDKLNQAGALFWPVPAPMTDFELQFQFAVTKTVESGAPADGLAFVAMTQVTPACREGGSNLCLLGTSPGFGVVVRTHPLGDEPDAAYMAIVDTSLPLSSDAGNSILGGIWARFDGGIVVSVPATATDPPATSWRTVCVRVASGVGTVLLDGTTVLAKVPVPAYSDAYWGFIGATGSDSERAAVRNVVVQGSAVCGGSVPCADASLCGAP